MALAGVGQVGQAALFILVKSDCSALRTFRIYGTTRIPPRREHQHEIRRQRIGIGTVVISAAIVLRRPVGAAIQRIEAVVIACVQRKRRPYALLGNTRNIDAG